MSSGLYGNLYKFFAGAIRLFFGVRVTGAENEPETGAYIACSNHLSNADVIIIAASLKRQVRFLAKAELFKVPLIGPLVTALGAYPIVRGGGDVGSIKRTIALLENGEIVGYFPQGTRYAGVDPRGTDLKNGVGMIMYRTGAPALPICLQTKNFKIRPFRRTCLRIGKPVTLREIDAEAETGKAAGRAEYERAAKEVFARILDMLE